MKRFLLTLATAAALSSTVHAADDQEPPVSRINELIPATWVDYPAIEPAIPEDFVMRHGDDGMTVMWGSESDLDSYPSSVPNNGIYVLKHSMEHQTGPKSFSFKKKDLIKKFNEAGLEVVRAGNSQWGEYPIFFYEGTSPTKETVRSVWVGLNSPEKTVLVISMIPTNNMMNDERQWNRLLNGTKQLKGYEYFRAMGSDMKDGCTKYSCAMGAVEAKVQQRKKDKRVAIKITPVNEHTTFNVQKTVQATMMGPWRHAEPITKIYGTMVYEDDHYTNIINSVINVFNEQVDEFTIGPNKV